MTRLAPLALAALLATGCTFSISSTPNGIRVHEPAYQLAAQTALVCTATLVGHWIWGDDAGRWIGYAGASGANVAFEATTYVLRDYADLPANGARTVLDIGVPGVGCAALAAWLEDEEGD